MLSLQKSLQKPLLKKITLKLWAWVNLDQPHTERQHSLPSPSSQDRSVPGRRGGGSGLLVSGGWATLAWGRHSPLAYRESLFHNQKVLPKTSCCAEQKLSLVFMSGEVRLGSGVGGVTDLAGTRASIICLTLWSMKKDTILCVVFRLELSMMHFILPCNIFFTII